jgi:hypothetical protein
VDLNLAELGVSVTDAAEISDELPFDDVENNLICICLFKLGNKRGVSWHQ